jgi:hypothetical protein
VAAVELAGAPVGFDPWHTRTPSPTTAGPSTDEERYFCALFERVTGLRPSNIHQHIFEIGGDLLSMARVIEIAKADGMEVYLPGSVLEHASVSSLAKAVGKGGAATSA